jgi:glutamate-ammonia-ligase adenylyltransferase
MNRDEFLIKDLPDTEAARRFLADLSEKHPSNSARLVKHEGLLSDVLTLASYSPLLATTLLQNPGYIDWLKRRRADSGGRSKDELLESLARFSLTNSQLDTQMQLARFRRRELLRIFLRDIRRLATIAEITEEISNLADAILEHALRLARQELENRFGLPLESDEKGRSKPAGFCIVSLGKLGSKELNYSSDIDLLFMYSADGITAATGTKGPISNREFSIKLAERIVKLVGEQTGEGSAYRVDMRLRPHGRIGPLAMSVADTARYYLTEARAWERQVMIRSRASAGDAELFRDFFSKIEEHVFSADQSIHTALENVRGSKERIDKELKLDHGFNVKLGRGGIREIEFIAQALQLAFGGEDRWLRAPHTLISLARLGDRDLITPAELTRLFDAYDFLRRVEHILQMEHGLQTHVLPNDPAKRKLIAARMNTASVREFEKALALHTKNVARVFERVFREPFGHSQAPDRSMERPQSGHSDHGQEPSHPPSKESDLLNRLSADSPRFAPLAAADVELLDELKDTPDKFCGVNYRELLFAAIASEKNFRGKLAALRRAWHTTLLRIAVADIFGGLTISRSKIEQTALAEASIEAAFAIASYEVASRLSIDERPLRMAALALGKLGGGGVDYDSDLDLVLVYGDETEIQSGITRAEFFGRAAEVFVNALSSMTRNGSLYRVDLRLRPHGNNGPSAISLRTLNDYTANEAAIWELLAYVKLRGAGGDMVLAREAESSQRDIIQMRAAAISWGELRDETLRVRKRLEKERAGRLKSNEVDLKYGEGGLLDIYFATRFLQLRDQLPDTDDSRSTGSILKRLHEQGSLDTHAFEAFLSGHAFLSDLDHNIRLTIGRNTRVPVANPEAMERLARRMKITSVGELIGHLTLHRLEIRKAFESILGS